MTREIKDFAEFAAISAAAMRVFVLDKNESGLDRAEAYVRDRCEDCAQMLDLCADRIVALENFVTSLTKVKAITDTPEFGHILDELMTQMEDASEAFENNDETID